MQPTAARTRSLLFWNMIPCACGGHACQAPNHLSKRVKHTRACRRRLARSARSLKAQVGTRNPGLRFTAAFQSFFFRHQASRLMAVVVAVPAAVADDMPRRTLHGFAIVSRQSPASDWPDSDTRGYLTGSVAGSAANTLVPTPSALMTLSPTAARYHESDDRRLFET